MGGLRARFEPPDPLNPKPPPDELNRLVADLREANERLVVAGVRLQQLAEEADGARRDAERSRKQAEAASQAKDEFVATVSHELRTPLNAILGWIQLLRHSAVPGDTTRRGLEVIERNANLLTRVIADLLEISAIITGKVQLDLHPIDVAPLLASSIDTLRPSARAKDISLETEVQPVGDIFGDPARLQQILWNLLSNAIKFTAPGGRVRVDTGAARHDLRRLSSRIPASASIRSFFPTSSSAFARSAGRRRRRSAVSAWDWRSFGSSSSCMGAQSVPQATARTGGRRSSSRFPWCSRVETPQEIRRRDRQPHWPACDC